VVHVRINADSAAPWLGVSPLRTASLSAGMLHAVESALSETWETMPFGSMIVPMPENPDVDNTALGQSFRGQRGRVLLRESVAVTAAGAVAPQSDWRPSDVTPSLEKALPIEALTAARESIALAYGVLPGLLNGATTGPMVREAQRHLAAWVLSPISKLVAEECSAKLGGEIAIDVVRPLQAMDVGGRARALLAVTQALGAVKAGEVSPADLAKAEDLVDL
jgi:phage portal protein BeeE